MLTDDATVVIDSILEICLVCSLHLIRLFKGTFEKMVLSKQPLTLFVVLSCITAEFDY